MPKVIIFDLDGTLYKSAIIYQKFAEAAYHTYAKTRRIKVEEAKVLLEESREELKGKRGYTVPYTLALISLGIPIEKWHRENINFFNAGDYLKRDEKLINNLNVLKKSYKLAVLTNNNHIQTERILKALGIIEIFDYIFTYESFKLIKPDLKIFKMVTKKIGVETEECLMVGDRYDVDLVPAKEIGMEIFEVKGPDDIEKLFGYLRIG